MKRIGIRIILAGILLLSNGCKEKTEDKVLTNDVIFQKEGELILKKAANDSIIKQLNIEIADNEYETQTGLMYRKSMPDDQGMLFVFEAEEPRSFYMKNTEFALDIIFIDADNRIVSIQKDAKPLNKTPLPSEAPAKYVLEVNAGLSDQWNLEKGDIIDWKKVSE